VLCLFSRCSLWLCSFCFPFLCCSFCFSFLCCSSASPSYVVHSISPSYVIHSISPSYVIHSISPSYVVHLLLLPMLFILLLLPMLFICFSFLCCSFCFSFLCCSSASPSYVVHSASPSYVVHSAASHPSLLILLLLPFVQSPSSHPPFCFSSPFVQLLPPVHFASPLASLHLFPFNSASTPLCFILMLLPLCSFCCFSTLFLHSAFPLLLFILLLLSLCSICLSTLCYFPLHVSLSYAFFLSLLRSNNLFSFLAPLPFIR
jgi:hypothetical protein